MALIQSFDYKELLYLVAAGKTVYFRQQHEDLVEK